ncbi:hypothetical protein IW140_002547 [Coemansia sp. RSA 1813]|nr:hypothetical protein EV178_002126 [Coemansia sp. RSA 1646]KAJ1772755.1 hypothetical protein LPJ74_001281 [Coemansia sp. RSA 1843]KAJ2090706.1 hypothetical protein IW138_002520 [Coemansia sp. RSA 986]KAJ2216088.1 hypothetical protein EV179_001548 [Coemansia sp. RSA 487]KAJ2570077.1 hypothetical protein IW140_002547 [Coemansia sp. RSA 1813]
MNSTQTTQRPWRPTQLESRAYNQIYCHLDKERHGIVALEAVRSLISRAHIHHGFVQKILQLAVASGEGGADKVTRREFYVIMKMISLVQSGRPVSMLNLGECSPLPIIDGVDLQRSRSSVLSYAPQRACSSSTSSISSISSRHRSGSSSSEDDGAMTDRSSNSTLNSAGLFVDTKLADLARMKPSFGIQTPVSTDSVTELLSRIDEVVSSADESRIQRRATENELNSASSLRGELEARMARLLLICQKETAENSALAERLQMEESRLDTIQGQVKHMQKNIAYIAWQRSQLVERLQRTEERQRHLEGKLEQLQQFGGGSGGGEGDLAPRPTVSRRYETARRNRLSSVFVKATTTS